MTNVDFHLQLNHNDTWSMSRLHFHDYCELLLPLTSPGNIFVNDQVYPLRRGTLYLIGENTHRISRPLCAAYRPESAHRSVHPTDRFHPDRQRRLPPGRDDQ